MAYCPNQPYIETRTVRFTNFSSLRAGKGLQPGSGRISFTVTNLDAQPDAAVRLEFPTVYSLHNASGVKRFAGILDRFTKTYIQGGSQISYQGTDFTPLTQMRWIPLWFTPFPMRFDEIAENLIVASKAFDPNLTANLLTYGGSSDPGLPKFEFAVREKTLFEALNELVAVRGYAWDVTFGGSWPNITTLKAQVPFGARLAEVVVFDLNGGRGRGPVSRIVLPHRTDGLDCAQASNLAGNPRFSMDFSGVTNRVTVLGHGGYLDQGQRIPPVVIPRSHDIPSDASARHFPLGPYTVAVNRIEMRPVSRVLAFSPEHGPVGGAVTIDGINFSTAEDVFFNGIRCSSFSVASDTRITTAVPVGATTGKISVETRDAGTAFSRENFTVD